MVAFVRRALGEAKTITRERYRHQVLAHLEYLLQALAKLRGTVLQKWRPGGKDNEHCKTCAIFDFYLCGGWDKDVDRRSWIVIDVRVVMDTPTGHSESYVGLRSIVLGE